jgi:hypothetical protein
MKQLKLTQGKTALVDYADYERASTMKWSYHKHYNSEYAIANIPKGKGRTTIELHRFILQAPKGTRIDHRNGNGLDCQRHNLRDANHSENARNRPAQRNNKLGLKGVHRHGNTFAVQIATDFGRMRLGDMSIEEARTVYNAMCHEFHGEFANPNP